MMIRNNEVEPMSDHVHKNQFRFLMNQSHSDTAH
jgi:hypothetical protein